MENGIDILAFGAHPDDVEIGMGGTIRKFANEGKRIVICDLTYAECSSNGTVQLRQQEAMEAGKILGIHERMVVGLPDRGLYIKEEYIHQIIEVIRHYKPEMIFMPYEVDRHPDHGNATRLIEEAIFSAGVRKIETNTKEIHRATNVFYYMINGFHKPTFCIDTTETMNEKIASLNAYRSQFTKGDNGSDTPLTNGYIDSIMARETLFGKEVGTKYAEGFISKKPLLLFK
ncbi:MAG: bacillithiol biosynthesis deacetylase BshB1 [Bacillaceae bacterium]